MEEIRTIVREFIVKNTRATLLKDDDNIFELGYVNSLLAVQLATFVEERFSISIPNSELVVENFSSIGSVATLVAKLTADSTVQGQ